MSQIMNSPNAEPSKSNTVSFWVTMLNLLLAVITSWLLLWQLNHLKDNRQFGAEKSEITRDTFLQSGDRISSFSVSKKITPIPNVQADTIASSADGVKESLPSEAISQTKPLLNFFDIILIMLIAGALGGVLCNLRGIFGYYRDEGELPKDLHIPYFTRPFAAAIGGIFIYFVSSLLVSSITLTPIAEGIGFEGMISYIALAIVAGFGIQEFMERLKALATTLFGERQNETTIQRLRQIHRLKEKNIIGEMEFEELKSRVIQDAQMKTTLEALNSLKVITPPSPKQ